MGVQGAKKVRIHLIPSLPSTGISHFNLCCITYIKKKRVLCLESPDLQVSNTKTIEVHLTSFSIHCAQNITAGRSAQHRNLGGSSHT